MAKDTWILVGDKSRARVFRHPSDEPRNWTLVQEFFHPAAREMGYDLAGNRPYQIQHNFELGQKGHEGNHEVQGFEGERFARELCGFLHEKANHHSFETLVIAAPPKFLGLLRANMTKSVEERVSHFLPRDYTDHPPQELAPLMEGL